ncbi:hypothetical protein BIV57_15215 [Mangrovactinospora gilvigrisea]|uniref:Uncharacterized protein n=1 Tax=Mangrovactinospora gilvigrisea TaxID=1428644 RepID=A0A1J7C516_9ACTN|nr:hypothetical protein [Mangrovactinospora gilvigrisea]OIV36648.1 hypothetical protein BIV57_15215 [Mangrovactinospora gilvigrisea]
MRSEVLDLPDGVDPRAVRRWVERVLRGRPGAATAGRIAEALALDTFKWFHGRPCRVRVAERARGAGVRVSVTARLPLAPAADGLVPGRPMDAVRKETPVYGCRESMREGTSTIWAEARTRG